jgi:hypothetical protein
LNRIYINLSYCWWQGSRSVMSLMEAFQRKAALALQVEVPMASTSVAASNPHLPVGGGGVLEDWPRGSGCEKPAPCRGRRNPTGGGGDHVEGCPASGDPPHDITSVWLLWESYNKKDWLMFNNLNSDLNKKDNFTCERLGREVDGSPRNGGSVPYGDYPYWKNYVNH